MQKQDVELLLDYRNKINKFFNRRAWIVNLLMLRELRSRTSGVAMKDIAKYLGISSSGVSQLVDKLKVKGYILIRKKKRDAREYEMLVTEKAGRFMVVMEKRLRRTVMPKELNLFQLELNDLIS